MQDGCKDHMESYMTSNGIMFHGHLDYCQEPPFGDRYNIKLGDYGIPNAHNH